MKRTLLACVVGMMLLGTVGTANAHGCGHHGHYSYGYRGYSPGVSLNLGYGNAGYGNAGYGNVGYGESLPGYALGYDPYASGYGCGCQVPVAPTVGVYGTVGPTYSRGRFVSTP